MSGAAFRCGVVARVDRHGTPGEEQSTSDTSSDCRPVVTGVGRAVPASQRAVFIRR
jgi:hypothetical protein